ncbi:MAG: hypothetical protein ACOCUU_00125 [Nanoarchaeota archaeon]
MISNPKTKKALIFDASSLISLAMNGLLPILEKLKKNFKGYFLITREVQYEVIERPLKIKKFKLEALMIQKLLKTKILETPEKIGLDIKDNQVSKRTNEIMEDINDLFITKGKPVEVIDLGESSCLALSEMLSEKKMHSVICMDERTTRVLIEKPSNLQNLLEKRLHSRIKSNKEFLDTLKRKQYKIIRSAELMYLAYKKQLFDISDSKLLDAVLYALKFKGCAISEQEIEEIKKLSK